MINAMWVSRKLRAAGVNVSSSRNIWVREGVFVRDSGDWVAITIDIDDTALRFEHVSQVVTALRSLGIEYELSDDGYRIRIKPARGEE